MVRGTNMTAAVAIMRLMGGSTAAGNGVCLDESFGCGTRAGCGTVVGCGAGAGCATGAGGASVLGVGAGTGAGTCTGAGIGIGAGIGSGSGRRAGDAAGGGASARPGVIVVAPGTLSNPRRVRSRRRSSAGCRNIGIGGTAHLAPNGIVAQRSATSNTLDSSSRILRDAVKMTTSAKTAREISMKIERYQRMPAIV